MQSRFLRAGFLKRVLRCIGILLTVFACVFVGRILIDQAEEVGDRLFSLSVLVGLVVGAVFWVLLNCILGVMWASALRLSGESIDRGVSILVSLRTQVAKYLPGNVFHLAGRVGLARSYGVPVLKGSQATLVEALALCFVGGLLSLSIVYEMVRALDFVVPVVFAIVSVLVIAAFIWRSRLAKVAKLSMLDARQLVTIFVGAVAVFLVQFAMFLLLEHSLSFETERSLWSTLEMVTSSWVAGYVVVGSPGGLGVREWVLMQFAGDATEHAQLAVVATVFRLSAILGDVFSFLISFKLDSRRV